MAEYYGTTIIPARVRKPKDKPTAEGTVNNVSTWITATIQFNYHIAVDKMYYS